MAAAITTVPIGMKDTVILGTSSRGSIHTPTVSGMATMSIGAKIRAVSMTGMNPIRGETAIGTIMTAVGDHDLHGVMPSRCGNNEPVDGAAAAHAVFGCRQKSLDFHAMLIYICATFIVL